MTVSAAESGAPSRLLSLHVYPSPVEISDTITATAFVITGHFEDGGVRDLTGRADVAVADSRVARVEAGALVGLADGETTLVVTHPAVAGGAELVRAEAPLVVSGAGTERPVNFANDVVPIFSKHGCNAGGCHGKSGGQNGFRMSLFGFDPPLDYRSLVSESRGRRVFPAKPEHSLLLRKATGATPHGGGARIAAGSPEYRMIARWMRAGMPFGSPDDPTIESIEVFPEERILERRATQQLAVTATYSDGRRADVTFLAEYSVNDDTYLVAREDGLVTALDTPGLGAVLVRFRGKVDVFRATIPSGHDVSGRPFPEPRNFIDELVFARLRRLGVPPSEISSDAVFLRRASVDICGTTPSAEEVERFVADGDPDKRRKLIDRLLERGEYGDYFALFWSDILRNRRVDQKAAAVTIRFRYWLRESLAANRPFDELVRELICAEGNVMDTPAVGWYRALPNAKALADDTAQVFLGTRMQCARCHHHPHEKWSQEDYWHFANFFSRLKPKNNVNERNFTVTVERRRSALRDDEETSASYRHTYTKLRAPGGVEIEDELDEDPRQQLADWIVDPENPLFARAVVNRYWKHFLGRGIVEPEDDLRDTNPPSNPELLDALAAEFIKSGYDLRALVRRITSSATYQLSAMPNELNAADVQNFSRFQVRRKSAEVLLDSVDRVLGSTTRFDGMRRGARAIELPDEASRNYFLDTFGKPARTSACSCERSSDVTLSQVLHFLSSEEIQQKLRANESLAARYAKEKERALPEKTRELFLTVFARPPTAEESERVAAYIAERAPEGRENDVRLAWEDLVWALLNTKEFLFVQ